MVWRNHRFFGQLLSSQYPLSLSRLRKVHTRRYQMEMKTISFTFFKQFNCRHRWKKDASFYQLKKDEDKTHWVCIKCNLRTLRDRWDPPEGSQCLNQRGHLT